MWNLIFLFVDDLVNCARVCRSWSKTLHSRSFLKWHCRSFSNHRAVLRLNSRQLEVALPFMSMSHAIAFEGSIARSDFKRIDGTPKASSDVLNVLKFLTTLYAYKRLISQNYQCFMSHWSHGTTHAIHEWQSGKEYIYLYILGDSLYFMHDRAEGPNIPNLREKYEYQPLPLPETDQTRKMFAHDPVKEAAFHHLYALEFRVYADYDHLSSEVKRSVFAHLFGRQPIYHATSAIYFLRHHLVLPSRMLEGLVDALILQGGVRVSTIVKPSRTWLEFFRGKLRLSPDINKLPQPPLDYKICICDAQVDFICDLANKLGTKFPLDHLVAQWREYSPSSRDKIQQANIKLLYL
jgi:hypothetical protein